MIQIRRSEIIKNFIISDTDREKLREFSEKSKSKSILKKSEAIKWANDNGYIINKVLENKKYVSLIEIKNGMPIYYVTNNIDAAKTVSTNKVWFGGSSGLALDGNAIGFDIGVWDGGKIRDSHIEFYSDQISFGDNAPDGNDHSTHVAGTIAATGDNNNAKGMAPGASIISFDFEHVISEMSNEATYGMALSNHSYGEVRGLGVC